MASNPNATTPSPSRSRSGSRNSHLGWGTTRPARASPYPPRNTDPSAPNQARRRTNIPRRNWLPFTLNAWRSDEDIPVPSQDLDPENTLHTNEPPHYTIPVLAARIYRHERRLDDVELEQQETRSNWMHMAQGRVAQTYLDQMDLTETMGTVQNQVIGNRNEISVLQTRLVETETRLRETEDLARSLEQRLEEAVRMISRLTGNIERVVTLIPPPNPSQD